MDINTVKLLSWLEANQSANIEASSRGRKQAVLWHLATSELLYYMQYTRDSFSCQ